VEVVKQRRDVEAPVEVKRDEEGAAETFKQE
jgi:hypothetical protein